MITKFEMAMQLRAALASEAFRARLFRIQRFYRNVKSELRYRDALLEVFNEDAQREADGLQAFAEADKWDLVICPPQATQADWLRVEVKYHFSGDVHFRFSKQLRGRYADLASLDLKALHSERKLRLDMDGIVKDCCIKGCDLLLLFVQDRHGTDYGAQVPQRGAIPEMRERGVLEQFLHEQVQFDRDHPHGNEQLWQQHLEDMVAVIRRLPRADGYVLGEPWRIRHAVQEAPHARPLVSHAYGLLFQPPAH